jgi:hypothetical protein
MGNGPDWLRVRGIGRERFAGYITEYLAGLGFTVERAEVSEPAETRVEARLVRMNPTIPSGLQHLKFRVVPTSGGAQVFWEDPADIPAGERGRIDRFVRELATHLERSISTESHGTAKVVRSPIARLPWEPATNAR